MELLNVTENQHQGTTMIKQLSKNFTSLELGCQCGCNKVPLDILINKLQTLRDLCGFPLRINSGYRCVAHNKSIGGVSDSQHVQGTAADIDISKFNGEQKYKLIKTALSLGFTGIGVYDTFIHLDVRINTSGTMWVGAQSQ